MPTAEEAARPSAPVGSAVRLPDHAVRQLHVRLAREQAEVRLPSIAAGLVRDGEVVWTDAVGSATGLRGADPVDAETQYRIGSITKSMVAVTVLRLAADGSISLRDRIGDHLPELAEALPGVSITGLLTQSAGLLAETDGPWWERSPGLTWEQLVPSVRLGHDPGRRFHYTNVGFAVLGRLVEQVRGEGWFDVLQREVLTPLGMTRTTYSPVAPHAQGLAVHPFADLVHDEPAQDTLAMAPAGQLWSTAGDLCRWAVFLARGDEQVLPELLLQALRVPSVVDDSPGAAWTRAYGMGVDVLNRDGVRYVGHGGSMPGFQAAVRVDPTSGNGVALLTNSTSGPSGTITWDLLELLAEHAPVTPAPWTADPAEAELADVVGIWHWGPRPYQVSAGADGSLRLGPVGATGRWSSFRPNGDGTWTGLEDYWAGELLQVRGRGTASAHLDLGSFRLTRTPYDPEGDIPGGVHEQGWHA